MKIRILIALGLILVLSTYVFKANISIFSMLKIREIHVLNNSFLTKNQVKKDLSFLYEKNIFLLNKKEIINEISQNSFIKSLEIKKIFPNKIQVKVYEKIPIAIIQNKKKKYYFTDNNDLINFTNLITIKDIPVVFGDGKSFKNFYNEVNQINFPLKTVKAFYLFETKRWDLITKKNQTIKLPQKNFNKSLQNFLLLSKKSNFDKYKIFDYRIEDQLILK